jgi:hypothetical protein
MNHVRQAVVGHQSARVKTTGKMKFGGEVRNRTESSATGSLNILIYKAILTLILYPIIIGLKDARFVFGVKRKRHRGQNNMASQQTMSLCS